MATTNKVMELCAEGMAVESTDTEAARKLFQQAWDAREDDFDACIAAHYLARHQLTVETRIVWNERAIQHADAVRDDRVSTFYPSLYLNLAIAYEEMAHTDEDYKSVRQAREFFARAAERAGDLPDGPYAAMVKSGSSAGLRRADAILGSRPSEAESD